MNTPNLVYHIPTQKVAAMAPKAELDPRNDPTLMKMQKKLKKTGKLKPGETLTSTPKPKKIPNPSQISESSAELAVEKTVEQVSAENTAKVATALATQKQLKELTSPINPKAMIMRQLILDIPLNDFGLPSFVYRTDLIPLDLDGMDMMDRTSHLEAAIIDLDYTQGFPTLDSGEPFWSGLPFEPAECFRAFVAYLDLPRGSISTDALNGGGSPVRQLHLLSKNLGVPTAQLVNWSLLYYWPQRALAYDLFISASHSKQKEYRLQEIENKHFTIAQRYIDFADTYMQGVFTEPEKYDLSPAEVIALLKLMIQVQRLSVGVDPFSAKSSKETVNAPPPNSSLEVILRTIAQNAGLITQNKTGSDQSAALFDDPAALAQAQELIIRLQTQNNPRTGQNMAVPMGGSKANGPVINQPEDLEE